METAILTVSMGVMKPLLSKLTDLLGKEYVKVTTVRKQIEFLRDELSTMSATLEMLADAEKLTAEMKDWRDKLRELAYDIDDYVDTIKGRADRGGLKGFEGFIPKLIQLKEKRKFANEMEDLKKRAIVISERHKRYRDFDQATSSSQNSFVDPRLPWLYEEIENLVGIDGPKNHIIRQLGIATTEGCSTRRQVVSIVGCGGLGKTTLAKQIFDTIKSNFECAAFVSMSRRPDWTAILRQIAQEVGIKENNSLINGNVHQLINILREHLKDKRYFIVIDDVWGKQDWTTIMPVLFNNNCMSRIITTTRSVDTAKCCSSNQGDCVYQMDALSCADSKTLFLKRAFGSEHYSCHPHLKDVLDKILTKCGGLPLAIITVSSMLANVHAVAEWDKVLSAIGSSFAKEPDAETMTIILSLSYFDIPHHLRTCLLYLSVYPEDYVIRKQCLINRWIAEGFIHEKEGQTKYETGEGYFNDLINRSMTQPVEVKYDQANACRVHDIILDYIKCKAAEENFVAAEPVSTSEYKVRRLCVSNHNEEHANLWAGQLLSQVRSITIFGKPVKIACLPSTALLVLDLGECRGMEDHHLASIGKLFNLKYLFLGSGSITSLPEDVGQLQHLQTLDVRGTSIKELPRTIKKLQQLTHLYVDPYVRFPDGIIGQMLNLVELRQYGVQSYEQGQSPHEFSKLTKLRTLEITLDFDLLPDGLEGRSQADGIYNYVENLLSSCNLHNLFISDKSETLYPLSLDSWYPAASSSLKLCIEPDIYKVPNWMASLSNLGVLELRIICLRPEDVEILGEIPSLFFLKLRTMGATNGRIVVQGNNRFRNLKYFSLNICACGISLEFEAGSMPKLEHVKLKFYVHEMECLNGAPSSLGIQHLSALSKVEITFGGGGGNNDNTVSCVSGAISAAIKTLPNHLTVRFRRKYRRWDCQHFESVLWEMNEHEFDGAITEWLEFLQIRKDTNLFSGDERSQTTDGESELEDETHEKEEEEQTDEEKEAGEKTGEEEEEEKIDEDEETDEKLVGSRRMV